MELSLVQLSYNNTGHIQWDIIQPCVYFVYVLVKTCLSMCLRCYGVRLSADTVLTAKLDMISWNIHLLWNISKTYSTASHTLLSKMTNEISWNRYALYWRHNGCDDVSNHQPHDCLLNRLFRRRSKTTSKFCVNGLCAGNSPVTGEFPVQMTRNVENVPIWWRHHGSLNATVNPWSHISGEFILDGLFWILLNGRYCESIYIF